MRFGLVPNRPVFRDYIDRLEARPAFLRVAEIDGAMSSAKGG